MKKFISVVISAIMVLSVFSALPATSFAAGKKISLKKTSATLKISEKNGKTVFGSTKIRINKLKGVSLNKTTYKSSDKKVASVGRNGKITAKAEGKAKITVKVKYSFKYRYYTKKLKFKVKVKDLRNVRATNPEASADVADSSAVTTGTINSTASNPLPAVTSPASPSATAPAQASENTTAASQDTQAAEATESTTAHDNADTDYSELNTLPDSEPSEATTPAGTSTVEPQEDTVLPSESAAVTEATDPNAPKDNVETDYSDLTTLPETEPAETEPAETEPAETEPAETEPAETEPAETEPAETEPAETEPAETEPSETEPSETAKVTDPTDEVETSEAVPTQAQTSETEAQAQYKALNGIKVLNNGMYSFDDAVFLNKLSAFSNKLYEMSSKDESGNYSMSPVSVYMALAMLYSVGDEGVKGDIEALVNMNESEIAETGKLFEYLTKKYGDYNGETIAQLNLTNSIWLNNGEKADSETLAKLADELFCQAFETPFYEKNAAANKAIREFIKEQTNGKIDQNFDLSPQTVFALINTLYFRDIWDSEIEELRTEQRSFKSADGDSNCEFIIGLYEDGQVQETDKCRYFFASTNFGYKIKFILPKEGSTLREAMSAENLNIVNLTEKFGEIDEKGVKHFTRCIFPGFKITSDTDLKKILGDNNYLGNTFGSFTSPLSDDDLTVSAIKHKVVLDVTKKGIEGAAVTIIVADATAMPDDSPREYHDFILDSEFGFIITNKDNVILFEGQVVGVES